MDRRRVRARIRHQKRWRTQPDRYRVRRHIHIVRNGGSDVSNHRRYSS